MAAVSGGGRGQRWWPRSAVVAAVSGGGRGQRWWLRSAVVAADGGGGEVPLDVLPAQDGADLPGVLCRVAVQDLLQLGTVGCRAEGGELSTELPVGEPLGAAVGQGGARVADLRRELHGFSSGEQLKRFKPSLSGDP